MAGLDWRAELRRYAWPVLLLALVTAAALLVRGSLRDEQRPPAAKPRSTPVRLEVSAAKPRPPAGRFYVVRRGDTLGAIAERGDTSVERLLELNPGVEPTALRVGLRLRVG